MAIHRSDPYALAIPSSASRSALNVIGTFRADATANTTTLFSCAYEYFGIPFFIAPSIHLVCADYLIPQIIILVVRKEKRSAQVPHVCKLPSLFSSYQTKSPLLACCKLRRTLVRRESLRLVIVESY